MTAEVTQYNVGIQLSDRLYICRAKASADMDLDWTKGKEVQALAKGKAIYIKRASGKIVKLGIISSTKGN